MASQLAQQIAEAIDTTTNDAKLIDAHLLPIRSLLINLYSDRLSSGCPVCADELDAMKVALGTLHIPEAE